MEYNSELWKPKVRNKVFKQMIKYFYDKIAEKNFYSFTPLRPFEIYLLNNGYVFSNLTTLTTYEPYRVYRHSKTNEHVDIGLYGRNVIFGVCVPNQKFGKIFHLPIDKKDFEPTLKGEGKLIEFEKLN